MAVVCAGPKAILDVPATLEYLETRGVPVVAVGQAELPGLLRPLGRHRGARLACRTSPRRPRIVGDATSGSALGGGDPRLRAGPRGRRAAATTSRAHAVERAIADAAAAGIAGPALTPWLLARIAVLTDGASVRANTALIVNDARVAGELAGRLAAG